LAAVQGDSTCCDLLLEVGCSDAWLFAAVQGESTCCELLLKIGCAENSAVLLLTPTGWD
jgi:hypothetical protein